MEWRCYRLLYGRNRWVLWISYLYYFSKMGYLKAEDLKYVDTNWCCKNILIYFILEGNSCVYSGHSCSISPRYFPYISSEGSSRVMVCGCQFILSRETTLSSSTVSRKSSELFKDYIHSRIYMDILLNKLKWLSRES